jgi:hypothetical protein
MVFSTVAYVLRCYLFAWPSTKKEYTYNNLSVMAYCKSKGIRVRGRRGPQSCEMSRFPYFSRQSAHRWR